MEPQGTLFSPLDVRSQQFNSARKYLESLPKPQKIQQLQAALETIRSILCLFDLDRVDQLLDKVDRDLNDIDYGNYPSPRSIPTGTRQRLFAEFSSRGDFGCYYCGMAGSLEFGPDGKRWHIDHKQPVSNGGSNDIANLAVCCCTCNLLKATHSEDVFKVFLSLICQPLHIFLSEDLPHKKIFRQFIEQAIEIDRENYLCRMNLV